MEEVGVEVTDITYVGSQPWPFPHQLMVGYMARYAGGEIRVDEQELDDAQWFHVDELPNLPPPLSLARQIVNAWINIHRGEIA
jgi:NAD+ diphosphatase